jgi:hypothetical protein
MKCTGSRSIFIQSSDVCNHMRKYVDNDELKKLYENGYDDYEIAAEMEFTPDCIRAHRRKLGLPAQFRDWFDVYKCTELYEKGETDCQIARAMGLKNKLISVWRRHNRLPENKLREPVTTQYSIASDYARILQGESICSLISINAECIEKFRKVEDKDMLISDKMKHTGLSFHMIKNLAKVYREHRNCNVPAYVGDEPIVNN